MRVRNDHFIMSEVEFKALETKLDELDALCLAGRETPTDSFDRDELRIRYRLAWVVIEGGANANEKKETA